MKRLALPIPILFLALTMSSGPAQAASPGQTVTVSGGAALRERPGAAYRVTSRASAGSRLTVERVKDGWVKVRGSSGSGWLPASAVSSAPAVREAPAPRERPARPKAAKRARVRSIDDAPGAEAAVAAPAAAPAPLASRFDERPAPRNTALRGQLPAASPTGDEVGAAASMLAAAGEDDPPGAPPRAARLAPAPSDGGEENPLAVKPERVVAKTDIKQGPVLAYASELTPILQEPAAKARPVAIAREGMPLKVVQRTPDGSWLLVEGETPQDRGWVSATVVRESDPTDPATRGIQVALDAGVGLVTMSQAFASRSTQFLGNFELKSAAATVNVGSTARYKFVGGTEIGADFGYRFMAATPGIRVVNANNENEDLSVMAHVLDAGARIGTRGKGANAPAVYGRLGYHIEATKIDQSASAKLPSDTVKGPTIGGGIDVPGLTEHLGFQSEFNLLYPASREQTAGLREGTKDSTYGVLGGARMNYRVNPRWTVSGNYQFNYIKTEFQGTNERIPGIDRAERSNTAHMFLAGFNYAL